MRLDSWMVENQICSSRNKASELIRNGKVSVGGKVIRKPSHDVVDKEVILADEPVYVSRAAHKLEGFLMSHPVDIEGKRCLDIGASTGGFTQVLLAHKADSVDAVDVGKAQFDKTLQQEPRVKLHEQTDIRTFSSEMSFDIVTCDVSFISLLHLLEPIDKLAGDIILLLFKPQFEVGRDAARNRQGKVMDEDAIAASQERFEESCLKRGWQPEVRCESTLPGKEGNIEYFYLYTKQ